MSWRSLLRLRFVEVHRGDNKNGKNLLLYPLEMCQEVIDYYPQQCGRCGAEVSNSNDTKVYRHQVVEVPPVQPIVIEHRFHQMTCTCCGAENQAPEMSEIIGRGGYGSRVAAYVGLFSSQYRQSYRPLGATHAEETSARRAKPSQRRMHPQIQKIMQAVFGIEMSLGTINNLRTEVSEAVSAAVTQAQGYVQRGSVLGEASPRHLP